MDYMKRKFKITVACLCAGGLITAVVVFTKLRCSVSEHYQKKFVVDAGFLCQTHNVVNAIDNYAQAIQILHANGIDEDWLQNKTSDIRDVPLSRSDFDKIVNLLIAGAKSQELGISKPGSYDVSVYLQDYGEIEFLNFVLLPKIISQTTRADLNQKEDSDRAILIGKANIAVGLQFSAYDDVVLDVIGLLYKRHGLNILEEYAEVSGDKNIQDSIDAILSEVEKECKRVKKTIKKQTGRGRLSKFLSDLG
ncbi:MAG: hypothetical protein FVQ85_04525 [Planctomycetes bacterium]|nr:hypothetical protein [Planctomycetota bacterium]